MGTVTKVAGCDGKEIICALHVDGDNDEYVLIPLMGGAMLRVIHHHGYLEVVFNDGKEDK